MRLSWSLAQTDGLFVRHRAGMEMKKRADTQTQMFRSTAELRALYKAERRVKKPGLGRVIASRVLTEANARDSKITIIIGAPRRVEADHWLCPYLIEGIVESGIHYGFGVDALQSLLVALGRIRFDLEQTERPFIWFGDSAGIPQQVPTDFGRTYEQRVDRAIQRESKRAWFDRLRARKAEIASAEKRLKVLKKGASRWNEPAGKANLKAEITKQEAKLKRVRKATAEWEANLRKWKPEQKRQRRKSTKGSDA